MTDPQVVAVLERVFREQHQNLRAALAYRTGCTLAEADDALSVAYANTLRYADADCVTSSYVYVSARRALSANREWQFRQPWQSLDSSVRRDDRERARTKDDDAPWRMREVIGADEDDRLEARYRLRVLRQLHPPQRQALSDQMLGFSMEESAARRGKTYTWVNRHRTEGRRAFREAIAA